MGSKAQNSTSSEYGRIAYQIKRNHTCSNIIGNILPADPHPPPPPPTLGSKCQNTTFSKHKHCILNLSISPMQQNGSKYFAGRPPPPPPTQPLGSIGQNSTCSEHGPVAYHIKEVSQMQQHGRKYFASRLPPANTGV